MDTSLGEALPVVELGLGAKDADRDRLTPGTLGSLLELLDPYRPLVGRLVILGKTTRRRTPPPARESPARCRPSRAAASRV